MSITARRYVLCLRQNGATGVQGVIRYFSMLDMRYAGGMAMAGGASRLASCSCSRAFMPAPL